MEPQVGDPYGRDMSSKRDVRIAVVGTGFSGLAAAISLKKAGFRTLTIFERSSRVGGVWNANEYPGCACDVASSLYSFSFEPNPNWSRPFAPQPEIRAYLEHCLRKYDLASNVLFNTEVTAADFDQTRAVWTLTTASGETNEFDVVIAACGQLTQPSYPNVAGIDSFEGTAFHSAQWNHDHDLSGERVAVIGNGASAVQIVPSIAPKVRELVVFQRSNEYIVPKPDYQHPEWEKAIYRYVPGALKALRFAWWTFGEYGNPGFTLPTGRFHNAYFAPVLGLVNWQLRKQVRDPELRRKLTPDYKIGCKRILLSSTYYPAITGKNARVVTEQITGISPNGIVTADGVKHEVDTIVYATGFKTRGFVAPMKVRGVEGQDLNEFWADGPQAYLGMSVPKFPNFFVMYGPNTNFGGGSIVYVLESQARYIVDGVRNLRDSGAAYIDLKPEVFARFSTEMQRRLRKSVWAAGGCTSWYKNAKGVVTNNWAGTMLEYRFRTRRMNLDNYKVVAR